CSGCDVPKGGPPPAEQKDPNLETGKVPLPVAEATFRKIGKVADIEEGHSRVMDVDGLAIAVYKVNGKISVSENRCPHSNGPLGEGKLEGSIITCPLHQWKFDVNGGQCQNIPAVKLKMFEVKVEGEDIFIKI